MHKSFITVHLEKHLKSCSPAIMLNESREELSNVQITAKFTDTIVDYVFSFQYIALHWSVKLRWHETPKDGIVKSITLALSEMSLKACSWFLHFFTYGKQSQLVLVGINPFMHELL